MKYQHHEVEFDISDEWLAEAGVASFVPERETYQPFNTGADEILYIRFGDVAPLIKRAQKRGIFCDSHETGETAKQRVMRILVWLREEQPIEPVKVVPCDDPRFKFRLVEGCHRFHCALALGFTAVPAIRGFDLATLDA